jgi:hypothetical protein
MASFTTFGEVQPDPEFWVLYESWQRRLANLSTRSHSRVMEDEQEAYDELVEYVEAHELNYTAFDPRASDPKERLMKSDTFELILENKNQPNETGVALGGAVLIAPPVDEDYWTYRVMVSPTQAVVGFPKYSTIGIGFAKERDWNTNLPYTVEAQRILDHIGHNKGAWQIPDARVLRAIQMIQEAATKDRSQS